MPSPAATILADALARVEQVLHDFGALNIPALEAFNAGAAALVENGREPTDNQLLALHNLIDMFDLGISDATSGVAPISPVEPLSPTGGNPDTSSAPGSPTGAELAPAPEPLAGAAPVDAGATPLPTE